MGEATPRRPLASAFSVRGELVGSLVAGGLLAAGYVGMKALRHPAGDALVWMSLAIGMVYGGRAALAALLHRRWDIDVLMVLGAGFAAGAGHAEDGAMLLFLFTLSGALEDRAMRRAARAIEALHKLMPTTALVERGGEWVEVDPRALAVGERVKVRQGELVPADARVISGESAVDQAALTGESVPRTVGPGDEVYAGTINVESPFEAEVVREAAQSSLQRILDLVTQAQGQREPMQRAIDRLSQPYAISVTLGSAMVFLVWWLLLGDSVGEAALTAIALLIVASPCALVIATPTATLSAIGRAARQGVLFKGGEAIERLSRMKAACFDKTGTITEGKPALSQVHPVGWSSGPRLLAIAAALDAESTHPIAGAIREGAARRGVEAARLEGTTHVPARGIHGTLEGAEARIGRYSFVEEVIPQCLRARTREVLERIQSRGQIGVVVAWAGAPAPPGEGAETGEAAVLIMSDSLRRGAAEMIKGLHELGVSPLRMLTGDNAATARHVAETLGIDQWDAELMPQDKLRIVEEVRAAAGPVGVIGDGVNDAPALAAADASIAIGSIGSDAALESADIVLLGDDLAAVPWAVRLARRARTILRFNLAFAMSVIGVMALVTLVLSRFGVRVPLPVAVFAHEGGTLMVVGNALRLFLVPPVRAQESATSALDPQPEIKRRSSDILAPDIS